MLTIDKDTVQELLARHPRLHVGGYGRDPWNPAEGQDELLVLVDEIQRAHVFAIAHLVPRKTINQAVYSYRLKHYAEEDPVCCGATYICNGAMIAAMLLAGFEMEQRPHYNPAFAVSARWKTSAGLLISPATGHREAIKQLHPEAADINSVEISE